MPGKDFIDDLQRDYQTRKAAIAARISEFRAVYEKGDEAIFEELCYCILTAGSSARMGMRTIEALRDILLSGELKEMQDRARKGRVRFWRIRPAYIVQTREYLRGVCGLRLRDFIESLGRPEERRDFFAGNKAVKGVGYKESSHFLRNIGFTGYAILDKHILNSLREMRVITDKMSPSTRDGYIKIEKMLAGFAREIGIDMDHLDLLLWSRKTGEILK